MLFVPALDLKSFGGGFNFLQADKDVYQICVSRNRQESPVVLLSQSMLRGGLVNTVGPPRPEAATMVLR